MNITVLGLGHLGMVAAGGLTLAGHRVTGVDVDRARVDGLRSSRLLLYEPGLETWLRYGRQDGRLRFLHRDDVAGPLGDIVLLAVGTPPMEDGGADLRQVWAAIEWLKGFDLTDVLVVMKSTVPPGTGRRVLHEELRGTGARYVANPEFLREGRALEDWRAPDRIVIGAEPGDRRSVKALKHMYAGIKAPWLLTDIASAEMIKYASNALLATRISFINEIAAVCEQVGASIDLVSKGVSMDPRTGSMLRAGVGYGGSCFPKDVDALDRLACSRGLELPLLKSVVKVNNRQRLLPLHALRRRFGQDIAKLTVAVLGLAFKPDTDDVREAASLNIIKALEYAGATVQAFDPRANESARAQLPLSVAFCESPAQACYGAHAALLLTEWDDIVGADWQTMAVSMRHPKFLFDGRNALSPGTMTEMGFEYTGIGRGRFSHRSSEAPVEWSAR